MASLALKDGAALTVVSAILRHDQTSTTANIYAHVLKGRDVGAIEGIGQKVCSGLCNPSSNSDFLENKKTLNPLRIQRFFVCFAYIIDVTSFCCFYQVSSVTFIQTYSPKRVCTILLPYSLLLITFQKIRTQMNFRE